MKGLAAIRVPDGWNTNHSGAEQELTDAARRALARVLGARGDSRRIEQALGGFYATWERWEATLPDYNGVPVAGFFRSLASAAGMDATAAWADAQWGMAGHRILVSGDIGITLDAMDRFAEHVTEGILSTEGFADIEGVGRFELRTRPGTSYMNASTGMPVFVPPRREVHFRPLKSLNAALREGASLPTALPGHPEVLQTILRACVPGEATVYADGLGWFILKKGDAHDGNPLALRFRASAELTEAFTQL
jgi:nucleoid DNA-binding protein